MATKLMLCTLQCCRFFPLFLSVFFFPLFFCQALLRKHGQACGGLQFFEMEFILVSKRHKECAQQTAVIFFFFLSAYWVCVGAFSFPFLFICRRLAHHQPALKMLQLTYFFSSHAGIRFLQAFYSRNCSCSQHTYTRTHTQDLHFFLPQVAARIRTARVSAFITHYTLHSERMQQQLPVRCRHLTVHTYPVKYDGSYFFFFFFFSVCTHAHLVTSDLLPATPSQSSLLHH